MTNTATTTYAQPCVNHSECSGCMACVEMCPELFQWDELNEQVIVQSDAVDTEEIERAMAYCPNDCIEMDTC